MRRSRFPLAMTAAVLAFLYLPIAVLVVNSFNASRFGGAWGGLTLDWYARLFRSLGESSPLRLALRNTLLIGVSATLVSVVLGTTGAWALHRHSSRLQRLHFALIYTPLVIPEILMGMSLLIFFAAVGLRLSLFTVFLAHVTFCISFVAMVVLARLQDFDDTLLEAARDLGADGWTATRRVLLPLLAPGILAGGLLAFTLSVDDFVITFFVAGPGSTTLPVHIYSMIKHSRQVPVINALSALLLAATFLAAAAGRRLTERSIV